MSTTATREQQDRELLTDSAALVDLLGAVAHAHMLDDHARVEMLLAQVTQPACGRIATMLRHRARPVFPPAAQALAERLRPSNVIALRGGRA